MKRALKMKQKAFHHFKGFSVKQITTIFFGRLESELDLCFLKYFFENGLIPTFLHLKFQNEAVNRQMLINNRSYAYSRRKFQIRSI